MAPFLQHEHLPPVQELHRSIDISLRLCSPGDSSTVAALPHAPAQVATLRNASSQPAASPPTSAAPAASPPALAPALASVDEAKMKLAHHDASPGLGGSALSPSSLAFPFEKQAPPMHSPLHSPIPPSHAALHSGSSTRESSAEASCPGMEASRPESYAVSPATPRLGNLLSDRSPDEMSSPLKLPFELPPSCSSPDDEATPPSTRPCTPGLGLWGPVGDGINGEAGQRESTAQLRLAAFGRAPALVHEFTESRFCHLKNRFNLN